MTENRKFSQTTSKFPKINSSASLDTVFAEANLLLPSQKRQTESTMPNLNTRRTTVEPKIGSRIGDLTDRVLSPETNIILSKSITEDFDILSARRMTGT